MSELVLYHAVPSRSMTVHWMLEESGAPYRLEVLDLDAQEHLAETYREVNPMARVPALRHGSAVITETAAICAYLAEAFPSAGLDVPPGSPLRGEYLRWLFFGPASAEPAILWRALELGETPYQPFADVETVAATLREALRDREFIVGDDFSAADVVIGSAVMWGTSLMPVLPRHPELLSYWERLEQRPAWRRAHEADQALLDERRGA